VRDSPREFAEAIAELLEDPSRRKAIEAKAREAAVRRYDWDVISARQRQLYQLLAG
jgi:glycosyltransferase involved in cell wall biosynthesis